MMQEQIDKFWLDCSTGYTEFIKYTLAVLDSHNTKATNDIDATEVINESIQNSYRFLFEKENPVNYEGNDYKRYVMRTICTTILQALRDFQRDKKKFLDDYPEDLRAVNTDDVIKEKLRLHNFFNKCLSILENEGVHPTYISLFKFYFVAKVSYKKISKITGFSVSRIAQIIRQQKNILKEKLTKNDYELL